MKLRHLPGETLAKCMHVLEAIPGALDLDLPEPTGWHVLVMQYVRAESKVLPGGQKLFFAESTRREDEYQGRVGVVLALGPDCYADKSRYPRGAWVKPGDWVIWPTLESAAQRQRYGGLILAFLPDDKVLGRAIDPVLAVEAA